MSASSSCGLSSQPQIYQFARTPACVTANTEITVQSRFGGRGVAPADIGATAKKSKKVFAAAAYAALGSRASSIGHEERVRASA